MRPADLLLAIAVPVLWAAGFTLCKPAVAHFPPLLMMALAYAITAAVLIPLSPRPRTPWRVLALVALLSATVQGGLIFNGLRELPASTATLIVQLQVPFAVLCAWLAGRDRPDPGRILGIALAFAGVALVVGAPSVAALWPALLVASGALAWAAGQAVAQAAARDAGRTLFAGIAAHAVPQLVVASALLERGQLAALRTAGLADWAAIVGLTASGFILAYSIWYGLLRRYPMDQIAPFALLMPVAGVALAALALGERPGPRELTGGAVIVTGLALVALRAPGRAGRVTPVRQAASPEGR